MTKRFQMDLTAFQMDRGPFGSNHPDVAPLSPKDTTMTDLKIEVGKCYRTRDGRKARVLAIRMDCPRACQVVGFVDGEAVPSTWDLDGSYMPAPGDLSARDLISEWKEPRSGEVWVIVPRGSSPRSYPNKETADVAAVFYADTGHKIDARLGPIPWVQGQGLTGEDSE